MTGELFSIIAGDYFEGTRAVHEEVFSNVLAWLLSEEGDHGIQAGVLQALLAASGVCPPIDDDLQVEREYEFRAAGRTRYADIAFLSGRKLVMAIEVKTKREYEDPLQLADYRRRLGSDGRIVLLTPRKVSLLRGSTRRLLRHPNTGHCCWGDFLEQLRQRIDFPAQPEVIRVLIRGLERYFEDKQNRDFPWLMECVIEEELGSRFYSDEFKEGFKRVHPDVWAGWVDDFGERGQGGAHQWLMQQLAGQASVGKERQLIRRTGMTRRAPPDWGYPEVPQYEIVQR